MDFDQSEVSKACAMGREFGLKGTLILKKLSLECILQTRYDTKYLSEKQTAIHFFSKFSSAKNLHIKCIQLCDLYAIIQLISMRI